MIEFLPTYRVTMTTIIVIRRVIQALGGDGGYDGLGREDAGARLAQFS